ncbi:MAG TPA: hypothetical protein VL381_06575 [Rhodocyclaceae bacterium]|nr:hypothetical protein [Rhodocyclaceae bacterium]
MKGQRSLWQIFMWPTVLGLMTLIGLLSALVADGMWDGLSWLMLLVPVAIGVARGWFVRT